MKQLELFETEEERTISEMENFISEMELEIKKLEEQELFFEENNAFDWELEFPQLCNNDGEWTGFDVVIGNPPYIYSRNKKFNKFQKNYYYQNYALNSNQLNTFGLFIERAIQLTNKNGTLGFIVPNNLLTINSFSKLRKHIIDNFGNISVINILNKVFVKANVDTCIILFDKNINDNLLLGELFAEKIKFIQAISKFKIKEPDYIFRISSQKNAEIPSIIEKIEQKSHLLKEITTVSTGLKVYQTGKGKPQQTDEIKKMRKFHSKNAHDKNYGKYLEGADVCRYLLKWSGEYLNYGVWIAEPRKSVPFDGKRILVRQIPGKMPYCINATYTEGFFYNDINSMVIFNSKQYDLKYILAILNSKLISFWFKNKYDKLQRNIFPQFKVNELSNFPIFKIDIKDKNYHKIINFVDNIYNQKDVEKNYKELDKLIYKLYDLTKEEIEIIENETA